MNNKPLNTSSIVQVKSGEVIPPTLLRKLAEENKSAFGLVVREPDRLVVEKFHKLDDIDKQMKFLDTLMEGTKKFPRMFIFHDFAPEFDEDETMPWTVLKDSKGNPLLVVAIEGDFPKHVDNEYSESYMLMHDWLGPKIESMFKLVGNSPAKLLEYLHSAQFENDFVQVIGHRGVIGFMPTIGDPWVMEKNEIGVVGKTPAWGSASNAYGYTESVIAAATPAKEEPAKIEGKSSRYATAEEPKPEVQVPKVEPTKPTPVEKVADDLQPAEIDWAPPQGVHGKSLKQAYRAVNNGVLPDNWRDRPTIRIKTKTSVKDFKEMPTLTGAKDMTKSDAKPTDNKVLTMPIISGAQQSKSIDFIKKYVGDSSAVIQDPIDAQKEEAKLAKFSQLVLKTGNLDEIDRWTTAFIFAFVKDNPETAALAIIELRAALQSKVKAVASADKKLGDLTGTEQVTEKPPAETPAQPLPAPAEEPGRKSKYA